MNPKSSKKWIRLAAGVLISGLSLYLAVRNVSFKEVWGVFQGAKAIWVGAALVSIALNTWAKTLRWKTLLGQPGQQVGLGRLLLALLAGQMLNLIYPARVGDLSRAVAMGDRGESRAYVLGSILVEKLADTVMYGALVGILLLWAPLPAWLDRSIYILILLSVIGTGFLALLAYRRRRVAHWAQGALDSWFSWLGERLRHRLLRYTRAGLDSLEIFQQPLSLVKVSGWSVLIWGTAILNNLLVLWALDLPLGDFQTNLLASILVLVAVQAGLSLPSVPGRIGLFQYICILSLGIFGVAQLQALSYGILLHALVLIPAVLLGLAAFIALGLPAYQGNLVRMAEEERTW